MLTLLFLLFADVCAISLKAIQSVYVLPVKAVRYTPYCSYGARMCSRCLLEMVVQGTLVLYSSSSLAAKKANCQTDAFPECKLLKTKPTNCGKLLYNNMTMPSRYAVRSEGNPQAAETAERMHSTSTITLQASWVCLNLKTKLIGCLKSALLLCDNAF